MRIKILKEVILFRKIIKLNLIRNIIGNAYIIYKKKSETDSFRFDFYRTNRGSYIRIWRSPQKIEIIESIALKWESNH